MMTDDTTIVKQMCFYLFLPLERIRMSMSHCCKYMQFLWFEDDKDEEGDDDDDDDDDALQSLESADGNRGMTHFQ